MYFVVDVPAWLFLLDLTFEIEEGIVQTEVFDEF
jgi:hypothetical protein